MQVHGCGRRWIPHGLVEWLQGGGVVLVDPRGLPVLRYDADVWHADIAKDLKRLLRTSRIG